MRMAMRNSTLDAFMTGSEWFHEILNAGTDMRDDAALLVAFDAKVAETGMDDDLRNHAYCGLLDEREAHFGWD